MVAAAAATSAATVAISQKPAGPESQEVILRWLAPRRDAVTNHENMEEATTELLTKWR